MTMHSTSMTGVQLDRANTNAIVHTMRGVYDPASRLHAGLAAAGPVNDPDFGAVSPAVMKCAAQDALRLAGLRDRPFSHDNLFHTAMGWVGARADVYKADWDLLASCR